MAQVLTAQNAENAELHLLAKAVLEASGGKSPTPTDADQQRRELIRVLSRSKSLVTLIADTNQFDLRQACRVTKIALEQDPEFDKKLVEWVRSGTASTPDQIVRVLMVLESVCTAPRLLAHVLHLKHLEGRVRSKLTLMVGRLTRDPQWLRRQLEDDNPRVRANAIEGLWDVRADGLEDLLRAAMYDPHQRVAANAALALHKIGDVSAISRIYAMLLHPDEAFRRAGLWAVGQTRDPRFSDAVEKLLGTVSGEDLALASRVKEELLSSRAGSEFTSILSLEVANDKILSSGERLVRMCCVADSVGGWLGQPDLNALNFIIKDGKEQIEQYRLHWVNPINSFVGLIVQPRSSNGVGELLKPALRGAGVNEIYGFLPYQTHSSRVRGKEHDDASDVKFENYLEMSKEYLGRIYKVSKNLDSAISLGLSAMKELSGDKHLFVLVDPSVGDAGALEEAPQGDCNETHIHAIVWDGATPELRDSLLALTKKSGGNFFTASSSREFAKALTSVRAAQFGSFELSWQPHSKSAKSTKVQISCYSSYGAGKVSLH